MFGLPILSTITFLPLIGALLIVLLTRKGSKDCISKRLAFIFSFLTFLGSITLWYKFDYKTSAFQFLERSVWMPDSNFSYYMGVDGLSVLFIVLTALLVPICIIASWASIKVRVKEYMIAFLVLETLVIGVFCALDFILFFVFFELMLIPMFLIIGIWGSDNKVYAATKFFLYTLAGSVFLLLSIIYINNQANTLAIPELFDRVPEFPLHVQQWLFLGMLASFAVKVPMWPVHTWLPDAHVEAPTAGSVILAGILLKMGAYGFLRFSLPMLPQASEFFAPYIFTLSVIAVIYASLVALMQDNMKKLIAYSSIAHMGYVTIGIFTFNVQGIEGALLQMISHGLVSAALFLCVGVLYDRMHTKQIDKYGGIVQVMPKFAVVFLFFTMASIGLPGTSGFVGEILVLVGTFQVSKVFAALAATGVVLGAVYMLWLYKRVVFGEITNKEITKLSDMNMREMIYFLPLIILTLWMGIYPSTVTDVFHATVDNLIDHLARW